MVRKLLTLAFILLGSAALAQDITNHAVPIGGGPGAVGWKAAVPGTAGFPLVSNGPSADPSFQATSNPITCASLPALTGDVTTTASSCATLYTNIVPVAKGGTGIASGTSGGVLGYTATGTIASSTLLTANAIVFGGGVGVLPSTPLGLGTTTTLLHGNAAGTPTWAAVSLTADVTGILPIANGGTAISTLGTATQVLHGGASVPAWGAVNLATDVTNILPVASGGTNCSAASGGCLDNITGFSATGYLNRTGGATYQFDSASAVLKNICNVQGDILYNNGTDWVCLAVGSAGQLLSTGGAAANPSWVTASGTGTVTAVTQGTGMTFSVTPCVTTCTVNLTVPVIAANGGTGVVSPATHTIPINQGASAQANTGTGTTGQCLASQGASADPAWKSGCSVLLNTLTASTSASLADTTSFTSTYSSYIIQFVNLLPATNNTQMRLRVNVAGVQTTGYQSAGWSVNSGSSSGQFTSATFIAVTDAVASNTGAGVSGTLTMVNPSQTSVPKTIYGQASYVENAGVAYRIVMVGGAWTGGNGAVTGIEITMSSGNLTSGSVKIYGVP